MEPNLAPVTVTPTTTLPAPLPTLPGPMPPGPKLIYKDSVEGEVTIWAASAANPRFRRPLAHISDPSRYGVQAALSHDGAKLAYTVMPGKVGGSHPYIADLWVVNLDGSQPRRLATLVDIGRWVNYPLWSPDDLRIAFSRETSRGSGETNVWVIDVESGAEGRVGAPGETSWWPLDWSPDGRYFYFLGGTISQGGLRRVDISQRTGADYDRTEYIGQSSEGLNYCYFLSPDGQWILCNSPDRGNPSQHAISRVSTRDAHVEKLLENIPEVASVPVWHPNGQEITLGLPPQASDQARLRSINIQTRQVTPIAFTEPGHYRPRGWSPDGEWVAVQKIQDMNRFLLVVGRNGAPVHRIIGDGGVEFIGWLTGDLPSASR